jgi:hypothetical protein
MISDSLLILAGAFLFVHLLTDARRMVQVLRIKHFPAGHEYSETTCHRCTKVEEGLKEAWWEVATFVALIGHLAFDYTG